jgi:hypothetical protein
LGHSPPTENFHKNLDHCPKQPENEPQCSVLGRTSIMIELPGVFVVRKADRAKYVFWGLFGQKKLKIPIETLMLISNQNHQEKEAQCSVLGETSHLPDDVCCREGQIGLYVCFFALFTPQTENSYRILDNCPTPPGKTRHNIRFLEVHQN